MNIAVFGGSFNPVHNGHIDIAKRAFRRLELDRLVVVPAFMSPFKTADNYLISLISPAERLTLCKLAFCDMPLVTVSDYEIKKGGVSYTIDTLKYFKNFYSLKDCDKLFLIVGQDILPRIDEWHKIDEIRNICEIQPFERKLNISSTMIRENIAKCPHALPQKVYDYIIENKLYS